MTIRSVLIEIDTYNPATQQTQTLRLCNSKNPVDSVHNGNQYMAMIADSVVIVDDLFGVTTGGEAGSTVGTILLNNRSGRLDDWLDNQWADQPVRILSAPSGTAYGQYTTEFTGIARNPSATLAQVSVTVSSILDRARVPLCKDSYTGGGGIEGPTTLRNVRKPVSLGPVINVEPVPVDPANLIYQWHGHGSTQGVTNVYSSGNPLGASIGDAADYAALVALDVPPGRYATCNASGLIKIGAPIQKLTLDGEGCNDGGRAKSHGEIIERMLTKYAGLGAADVDSSSLSALNTAVPGDAQLWAQSDVTVLEIVIDMMASLHGYVKASPSGAVEFGLIRFGASSAELKANRMTAESSFSRLPIQQPFHKTELGYARVWSVHSDTEVVEVDPGTTLFRWTGSRVVPTQTNAAGGLKYYFNSPVSGPAIVMVEVQDAEGGVYVDLNGTELGPLSHTDGQTALYEIPTSALIVGENELSVYASNTDDSTLFTVEVARDYLSQTLTEITVNGVAPLSVVPESFAPGSVGGQGNLRFTTDAALNGATATGEFRHLDGNTYSVPTDLAVTLPTGADGDYYVMFSAQSVQDETGGGRFQALGARGSSDSFIIVREASGQWQAVDEAGTTLDFTPLATDALVFAVRVSGGEVAETHSFMALLGNDGAIGADGSSYAEKLIYQRAVTQPATPTGGAYDFGAGTLTPPTGWSAGIPGGSGPVWVAITSASVVGTTGVDNTLSWSTPVKAFQDGGTGIDGQAVDIVFIRATSQPSAPTPSAGVPTGYYATAAEVPAGSGRIYGAFGKRPTSSDPYTWDEPTIVEAQDGADGSDGDPGTDGADGADGLSVAERFIYRRAASAPSTPTGGSFNFGTGTLNPPSGWSEFPPAGDLPLYIAAGSAQVVGQTGTDTAIGWSSARLLAQNGTATSIIHRRAETQPSTPAASSSVPNDWYDRISNVPDGDGRLWSSLGSRAPTATLTTWDEPYPTDGLDGADGKDAPGVFDDALDSYADQAAVLEAYHSRSGNGEISIVTNTSPEAFGGKSIQIGNASGNDQRWLVSKKLIPFDPAQLYMVEAIVERVSGSSSVFVGIEAVGADGVTRVNVNGDDTPAGQHYFGASGATPSLGEVVTYRGFFRGVAASGNGGHHPNDANPGTVHEDAHYISALTITNHDGQTGETRLHRLRVVPYNADAVLPSLDLDFARDGVEEFLAEFERYSGSGDPTKTAETSTIRFGDNSGNDDTRWISRRSFPYDPQMLYSISSAVGRELGAGSYYVGVIGVAANGVTLVGRDGGNNFSGFWVAARQRGNDGYTARRGYFSGSTSSGIIDAEAPDPDNPRPLHTDARFFKIIMILNWSDAAGQFGLRSMQAGPVAEPKTIQLVNRVIQPDDTLVTPGIKSGSIIQDLTRGGQTGFAYDGDVFTFPTAYPAGVIPHVQFGAGGVDRDGEQTVYRANNLTNTGFTAALEKRTIGGTETARTDTGAVANQGGVDWAIHKSQSADAVDDLYTFTLTVDLQVDFIAEGVAYGVAEIVISMNTGAGFEEVDRSTITSGTPKTLTYTKSVSFPNLGQHGGYEFGVTLENASNINSEITAFTSVKYTTSSLTPVVTSATPAGAAPIPFTVSEGVQ